MSSAIFSHNRATSENRDFRSDKITLALLRRFSIAGIIILLVIFLTTVLLRQQNLDMPRRSGTSSLSTDDTSSTTTTILPEKVPWPSTWPTPPYDHGLRSRLHIMAILGRHARHRASQGDRGRFESQRPIRRSLWLLQRRRRRARSGMYTSPCARIYAQLIFRSVKPNPSSSPPPHAPLRQISAARCSSFSKYLTHRAPRGVR
jgi:hypothetical protein